MSDRPYRWVMDGRGRVVLGADTTGMVTPVRCRHCGGVYDVGTVTVTDRYTDCSVWTAPCCNRVVDDRRGGAWGGLGDIEYLPRQADRP